MSDPLDDYRALNDPTTRRRVERRGGYFVVEGLLALEALMDSPYAVRSVLATERRAERVSALVAGRAPLVVRSDAEVAAVAGFDVHRGVLAAADRRPLAPASALVEAADVVVVAEGIGDHENLGALFRNAAAFGAGAVLLDPTTADPLYRRSVRVSLGHVLRVPWTRLDPWPEALRDLGDQGFVVLALTPAADAEPIARVVEALGPVGRRARRRRRPRPRPRRPQRRRTSVDLAWLSWSGPRGRASPGLRWTPPPGGSGSPSRPGSTRSTWRRRRRSHCTRWRGPGSPSAAPGSRVASPAGTPTVRRPPAVGGSRPGASTRSGGSARHRGVLLHTNLGRAPYAVGVPAGDANLLELDHAGSSTRRSHGTALACHGWVRSHWSCAPSPSEERWSRERAMSDISAFGITVVPADDVLSTLRIAPR